MTIYIPSVICPFTSSDQSTNLVPSYYTIYPFILYCGSFFFCNINYSFYLSVSPSEGCQYDSLCYIYRKSVSLLYLRFLMILN